VHGTCTCVFVTRRLGFLHALGDLRRYGRRKAWSPETKGGLGETNGDTREDLVADWVLEVEWDTLWVYFWGLSCSFLCATC
jgi:hypothetical protein